MREIRGPSRAPAPWAGSAAGQRGEAGEDAVAAALRPLDDQYLLLRNLSLPGSPGDVDGVLLTPYGAVWVLEVKALDERRAYRCHGLTWEYTRATQPGWTPLSAQPTHQALFHARQIKGLLDEAGLPTYPRAVVVLATPIKITLEAPRTPVVRLDKLLQLVSETHGVAPAHQDALARALLRAAQG